ncbi:YceI family protein [Marinilabilia salmonicolor]|uniref:YceI family protein n=1 Tax=Marinilabilia salmonicolor TaxID=989 RepID=UPI00029AE5F2|nr:YceI family protein [Marinilabilia salmonicolor]
MTKIALQTLLIIALTLVSGTTTKAQKLNLTGTNNSVVVTGTSSLHDWEMVLSDFRATAEVTHNEDGSYTLTNAGLTGDANKLSSDNSMMDNKAKDALRAKKAPELTFRQSTPLSIEAGNEEKVHIKGNLKIAGETKPVSIPINLTIQEGGKVLVTGTATVLMSDYKMDPPTAMFGTVKTGDEVKVNIKLELK